MNLSDNLSLNEVIKSDTAIKNGIDNNPTEEHLKALKTIANEVFQPIRDYFDVPIAISSGYRSRALNIAIKGSATSQHCKGEALDLDADVFGRVTNAEIYNYIKDNLDFDQLIWEFGTDEEPNWVHVSYTTKKANRKMILKAYKVNGKSHYKVL
tara:strand:+ start:1010 stop:1471 length:462 start_codon:yes stop_codon:yes gene_type:complete